MSAFLGSGAFASSGSSGAGFGAFIQMLPGSTLIPGLSDLSEDFTIQLGDFALQDFEEPNAIAGGSEQAMARHEYPGGVRTNDTWGGDPEDPTFSGRMMGPTAEQRVQMLDTIVNEGLAVNFSYSQKKMLVILKKLTWNFFNYYDVEYTLTIEVIVDYGLTNPASLETNLDNIFNSDISSMTASVSTFLGGLF